MIKKLFEKLMKDLVSRQLQSVKSQLERHEAEIKTLRARCANSERALRGMKAGAKVSPMKGSWVFLAYTLGEKDYLVFYDFGKNNIGAIRQMLEKFDKAGIATRLASPFDIPQKKETA